MATASIQFNQILDQVKSLQREEQEDLQFLLGKILIEARRDEIASNFSETKAAEGKLKFSSSVDALKKML